MNKYGGYLLHDRKESPEVEKEIYEVLREQAWQTLEIAEANFEDYVITTFDEPENSGHRYGWVATPIER